MLSGKAQRQYHLMLLIPMIFLFVFGVLPKFGVVMAFQKFIPAKGFLGSKWVGLKYFRYMFELPDSWQVFENTLIIAVSKLVLGLIAPIVFALLLNEVRSVRLKRSVQTITYMPHFLSWVVLAIPVMNLFAYDGVVNNLAAALGGKRVLFMASNTYFRPILIFSHVWKEFGYGAIVYLAAIAGINPELYESAVIDGAGRAQRMEVVKAVDDPELQTLLELRYLCFKDWPDIACEMHCSESNVYKVHSRALQAVRVPKLDSKLQ